MYLDKTPQNYVDRFHLIKKQLNHSTVSHCYAMGKLMRVLVAFLILLSGDASACSMFLEDNIRWYEKIRKYEEESIAKSIGKSDAILIVRVLSYSIPEQNETEDRVVEEVVLNGPNPRVGQVSVKHEVKVLEVIRGNFRKGDLLVLNTLEPERFGRGECGGDPDPSVVFNVWPMDNTFKYLVYLNGHNILRHNMFVEWKENISAEEELLKMKDAGITKPSNGAGT